MKYLITSFLIFIAFQCFSQTNFLCPLDIMYSIKTGAATATTNSGLISTDNIFDRDDATLDVSYNVNPFIITVSFTNTVNLTSVRVIQSYGDGWFNLEAANSLDDLNNKLGSYELLLNQIPTINGVPIGGAVTKDVIASKKIFRLTVKRTTGDNYVHLNEWTLIGNSNYQTDAFKSTPSTISMHPGWEIWLNKPNTFQCPQISGVLGTTNFPIGQQCIIWSVSDPSVLELNTSTMKLKAIKAGTTNLIATIGTNIITIPVSVTRLQSAGEPDLSVRYIKRLPEINYVQNSINPTVEGWPAVGQTITWRTHVRNWSGNTYNNVSYEWKKNGIVIGTGNVNFLPDEEKTIQIDDIWAFQRDSIEFIIDKTNSINEFSELNNNLKIYTNSISANFYVEQSLYDYFHMFQNQLGVGTNSWDDWAQILHVKRWNELFRNTVYPDAPNGILDRIRIDSIVIVPDNSLPLFGIGLPGNNPNVNDRTVDLQWGFNSALISGNLYPDHTSIPTVNPYSNPFYFEASLLHELGHARYLIDMYGMDLTNTQVHINEGSESIAGSALLPLIAFDVVYYNKNGGLMGGPYDPRISPYEAMALNRIAYRRAVCGNMNGPCNLGIFINDLPTNNLITLKDQNNNILSNACVEIYNAVPQSGRGLAYDKNFDDIPDVVLNADANGIVNVGKSPFSANKSSKIFGPGGMNIIIRVEKNGKVGYKVIEATDFNMEYWRENTENANYTYQVNMLSCSDFSGSVCTCAIVPPPTITAGSVTTFCQGGSVMLTSSSVSGNQWFKDGIAINGATSNSYTAISGGSYTSKVTVSGEQSLASNAIAVIVNPTPSTPTITAGAATTFCQGGNVTLTSNAASGNQWYKDGVAISNSTATTLVVNSSGSYAVKVTLNGCESAVSNAIAVIVNPTPSTPTITAGAATTFCQGGNVTLTSNAASGNQWYKDGVAISNSTATTLVVNSSGSYIVKVTLNGCSSGASNTIVVTVNPIPPKPTVSLNNTDLLSSAANGNQWFVDGVLISGATSQTYRPLVSGQYSVQITLNDCVSPMSNNYYFIITDLNDPAALEHSIRVFPNPVTNKLYIVSTYRNPIQVQLLDMNGKRLTLVQKIMGTYQMDITRFVQSSYILLITDTKKNITYRKLIVKVK